MNIAICPKFAKNFSKSLFQFTHTPLKSSSASKKLLKSATDKAIRLSMVLSLAFGQLAGVVFIPSVAQVRAQENESAVESTASSEDAEPPSSSQNNNESESSNTESTTVDDDTGDSPTQDTSSDEVSNSEEGVESSQSSEEDTESEQSEETTSDETEESNTPPAGDSLVSDEQGETDSSNTVDESSEGGEDNTTSDDESSEEGQTEESATDENLDELGNDSVEESTDETTDVVDETESTETTETTEETELVEEPTLEPSVTPEVIEEELTTTTSNDFEIVYSEDGSLSFTLIDNAVFEGKEEGESLSQEEALVEIVNSLVDVEELDEEAEERVLTEVLEEKENEGIFANLFGGESSDLSSAEEALVSEATTNLGNNEVLEVSLNEETLDTDEFEFEVGSVVLNLDTRQLTPGTHTLTLEILNPFTGEVETFTQEFDWGVLALNFDRDNYIVGESANISIGVLDSEGVPVCEANPQLRLLQNDLEASEGDSLETPENTDVEVFETGLCNTYDSTNIVPDYEADFTFETAGTFTFEVEVTQDDETKRLEKTINVEELEDVVEVNEDGEEIVVDQVPVYTKDLTVARDGATRLYPVGQSPMSVNITLHQDFEGEIVELVPSSFELSDVSLSASKDGEGLQNSDVFATGLFSQEPEFALVEGENTTEIKFEVSAEAGTTIELLYTYDAPNVSPDFFVLGPVKLMQNDEVTAREGQVWQIANDNPTTATAVDLVAWYRADKDVFSDTAYTTPETVDGNRIFGWLDQSGEGNNVSASTSGPLLEVGTNDGFFNYHDYFTFSDVTNDHFAADDNDFQPSTGAGEFNYYIVGARVEDSTAGFEIPLGWGPETTYGYEHSAAFDWGGSGFVGTDLAAAGNGHSATTTATPIRPAIYRVDYSGVSQIQTQYFNGSLIQTDSSVAYNIQDSRLHIGADPTADTSALDFFDGYIAEIIIYDKSNQSVADVDLIESYLSLKYGINRPQDDGTTGTDFLASTGEIMFDASESADINADDSGNIDNTDTDDYVYNVAGLAKDNENILVNEKSRSTEDNTTVIMSLDNNADLDDQEFLFWGNNGASYDIVTTEVAPAGLPTSTTARFERE